MEIRYQNHQTNIERLKENGERLVIASTHEDCSDRCFKWQGRVYSLDGSSGVTDDGREYAPLEVATDVTYTTKAGKTYKNGLLGFNCRHRLIPYMSGIMPEPVTKEEQRRQYAINNQQRQLERQVREERLKAELYKAVDPEAYKAANSKARALAGQYRQFCKENSRAFYPERIQILKPAKGE
jgi:hypothetical protein